MPPVAWSERANALGSTAGTHFLFPACLSKQTKAAHGTGYNPNAPQRTWRTGWRNLVRATALRAAAGITDAERQKAMAPFVKLRFHDLRLITKLAESEASDGTIMGLVGHLDHSMLEHYSHIRAAAKRKAVDSVPCYVPEETPVAITKRVQ